MLIVERLRRPAYIYLAALPPIRVLLRHRLHQACVSQLFRSTEQDFDYRAVSYFTSASQTWLGLRRATISTVPGFALSFWYIWHQTLLITRKCFIVAIILIPELRYRCNLFESSPIYALSCAITRMRYKAISGRTRAMSVFYQIQCRNACPISPLNYLFKPINISTVCYKQLRVLVITIGYLK